MKLLNRQTGFTILELIIVIAIISITAGFAIPNVMATMPKYRLNGAVRQMRGELMKARMRAVTEHCNVRIKINNDHIYTIWTDINHNGNVDSGEEISQDIRNLYKDITIYRFLTLDTVIFSPKGYADQIFLIGLRNSSGLKAISTTITGRVSIL